MRKFNYLFVALMTMLLVASCSQDETLSIDTNSNEAMVSFNLELPDTGPQSRAIGDGETVNELVYGIFDEAGAPLSILEGQKQAVKSSAFQTTAKKETISLSLLKGKTYQIAFWAQVADKDFYTTDDLKAIVVNYEGDNNDESRDAFFGVKEFTVAADASIDVVLNRPFAQINVGVTENDYKNAKDAGLEVTQSSVVINKVANKINLLTGEVDGDAEVKYTLADIPTDSVTLTAAGENYTYLSMSYILAVKDKSTLESLKYVFKDTKTNETVTLTQGLTSVPVQRNYRTNIVGKLLTGDIDFDITIVHIFNEPDNNSMVVKNNTELEAALDNKKVQNIILDGTFNEKINIKRSVTISGIATTNGIEVKREADDVTFSDLQLTLKGNHTLNTWAKNTIIKNSVITTNGLGVYFNKSSSGSVINNEITGRKAVGADTDQEVVITGNTLMFTSMGIEVFVGSARYEFNKEDDETKALDTYTVEDNTFIKQSIVTNDTELSDALNSEDNQIVLNGTFAGFEVTRPVIIVGADSPTVRSGSAAAVVDGGIKVKSNNVVIDGLTAEYVEIYSGVSGIVVKNNTITGHIGSVGIGNSTGPVHLGEAVIQNNTLNIGTIGFYPTQSLDKYTIEGNNIQNNPGEGIWLHYTADNTSSFDQAVAIDFATDLVENNNIAEGGRSLVKVETASTKVTEDGLAPTVYTGGALALRLRPSSNPFLNLRLKEGETFSDYSALKINLYSEDSALLGTVTATAKLFNADAGYGKSNEVSTELVLRESTTWEYPNITYSDIKGATVILEKGGVEFEWKANVRDL